MTARQYAIGQAVFDRDRQAHGHVVALYPSPLVARLADTAGFQWIARTVACEPAAPQPATRDADKDRDGVWIPAGRMPVDVPQSDRESEPVSRVRRRVLWHGSWRGARSAAGARTARALLPPGPQG
ncbi:hypothetical protein [Streptomyces sp. NPDC057686]|uniref:hypothetical protein n=1 Tax=Streptomyces sp. NPDC057686 TaxID=3346212 RepID=UPI0036A64042